MSGTKTGLVRTTSMKLQRMFSSRRGRGAATNGVDTSSSSSPLARGGGRLIRESRVGMDMQRTPTHSSGSSSSSYDFVSFHTTPSSSSSSSGASTFSADSSPASSTRSSSAKHSLRNPGPRLVIRPSTFEWTWNWDDNWSSCVGGDAAGDEVAPVFPRTLPSPRKWAEEHAQVSPLSSAVDLAVHTLTQLPNRMLGHDDDDDDEERARLWRNLSWCDSSDDDDDGEGEAEHSVFSPKHHAHRQTELQPQPFMRRRRSNTAPSTTTTTTTTTTIIPSIVISAPQTLPTASSHKRNHTFTIRRKPPPAFIDVAISVA
ncbi:hypothetical protein EX895_003651 [Sporisorium graminicola]|uniref:Uncharacterized protein n=1 Tax=Sporisorium graminicola TaxID=280036 RepID=A0A4U7KR99_9BASI|nr:hypothetical protein EX895_003651 [Sporisorium graminicola]TKY86974.1 hypothetical protein EX895_003651 [Sporisorium graminicola]